MRRNVTIGFSEEVILRLQGAAAMARMPLATYLRWLIRGDAQDRWVKMLSAILERLDGVVTAIANLSPPTQSQPAFSDISGTAPIAQGGTGQTMAPAGFDALAPTTTRGDLIYRNAVTNTRLPAGTAPGGGPQY